MSEDSSSKPRKPAPAASTDLIEQQAAEAAKKRGKPRTTDEDRKRAYHDLRSTAPKVDEDEGASH